jgi:hypothetical protein
MTGEALTAVKHPPFCDVPGIAPGRRICAEVQLANGGKTPAVGVRIIRHVIVTDEKTAPARIREFSVPPYKPEGSVMGPNGGTSKFDWATGVTEPLTGSELAELKAGKKNIFIFGVVQYTDVFEKFHETGYCAFLLPSGAFMNCPYHNWFDNKLPGQD